MRGNGEGKKWEAKLVIIQGIRGIGGCRSFNCLEATNRRAARHVAPQPILGSDFCGTGFFLVEEQKAGDHADPTATELS